MKNHKLMRVNEDTYDMVKAFAIQCDIPMSKVIQVAVEKHINESQGSIPPTDATERKKWLFDQLQKMMDENKK
jgi:hypothetical protein